MKSHGQWLLICQLFSTFGSAAGKYLATVGSSHSLQETVFLLAVKFFRLICSFHGGPSLTQIGGYAFYKDICGIPYRF